MKLFFKKTALLALIATLALTATPSVTVSALGEMDPSTPPAGDVSNEKLEQVWARQLRTFERIGRSYDRLDQFTTRAQDLIDRADANGKDVSSLQQALDAFEDAAKDAHPIYESTRGLVNSHQGFDENGKVTDPQKAKETVQAMHDKLQEIKSAMDGTGKALREAIKAFREANPRPAQT
ncbi:MAG TPA: hypothetical protein VFY25_14120, partial [Anaerolineales bacterium]|nr:hypothetical protein [Anaerolineales bacterium]